MTLAEKVITLRTERGWTQKDLADELGFPTPAMIVKVENGMPVSNTVVKRIAEALNTTPAYLLGWDSAADAVCTNNERSRLVRIINEMNDDQVSALLMLLEHRF